jgi:hypothetical protein
LSFNVFLSIFLYGEPHALADDCVQEAFGAALVEVRAEPESWRLDYDGEDCEVFVTRRAAGDTGISALMVARPIADERLWDSLYRVMRIGNVLMFYLGCPFPLVADEAAIPHVPGDILEAIGKPVLAVSGADICRRWALVSPGRVD